MPRESLEYKWLIVKVSTHTSRDTPVFVRWVASNKIERDRFDFHENLGLYRRYEIKLRSRDNFQCRPQNTNFNQNPFSFMTLNVLTYEWTCIHLHKTIIIKIQSTIQTKMRTSSGIDRRGKKKKLTFKMAEIKGNKKRWRDRDREKIWRSREICNEQRFSFFLMTFSTLIKFSVIRRSQITSLPPYQRVQWAA